MTLLQILGGAVGVVALAAAGTLLLPRHIHVERTSFVPKAPAAILAAAASTEGYQTFNPYLSTDPDLRIEPFGPNAGVGAAFRFEGKDGKGTQTVASVSASEVHYAIDLGPMGRPKQAIKAVPDGAGAQVTWSMDADMGFNPVARIIGLFMDSMMGKTFETGLKNMAQA